MAIAVLVLGVNGEPLVDSFEFSSFVWRETPTQRIGANYRRMLQKWKSMGRRRDLLKFNTID